ncbi:unnamed protein product [Allacma fusca]|uniref:Uncharacterized protein n=1 Tax=Allacma fusca TaxID=39272 RepID=A0A8J2L920_9HEXA|nr:unnamed protein product [Allacma fusca]
MSKLLLVVALIASLCVYTQAGKEAQAVLDDIKLVVDNVGKLNTDMEKLIAAGKGSLTPEEIEKLKKAGQELLEKELIASETFEKFGDLVGLPKPTEAPPK